MEDCVRAYCRRTTMRILTLIQPTRRRTLGRARARRGAPATFRQSYRERSSHPFETSGPAFGVPDEIVAARHDVRPPLALSSCQSRGANGGTAARAGRKERARVAVLPSSAMPPKKKQSHINRMAAQVRCRVASPSSTPPRDAPPTFVAFVVVRAPSPSPPLSIRIL
eukprot:30962-Pelagococcus_subviridis.AAC.12